MNKLPDYKLVEINYEGQDRKLFKIKIRKKTILGIKYWSWLRVNDWIDEEGEYDFKTFESEQEAHDYINSGEYLKERFT